MARWSLKTPAAKGVCVGPASRMSSCARSSVVVAFGAKR